MANYSSITILQGTIPQLEKQHAAQLAECNRWTVTQTTHVHTPLKEDGKPDLKASVFAWTTLIPSS